MASLYNLVDLLEKLSVKQATMFHTMNDAASLFRWRYRHNLSARRRLFRCYNIT